MSDHISKSNLEDNYSNPMNMYKGNNVNINDMNSNFNDNFDKFGENVNNVFGQDQREKQTDPQSNNVQWNAQPISNQVESEKNNNQGTCYKDQHLDNNKDSYDNDYNNMNLSSNVNLGSQQVVDCSIHEGIKCDGCKTVPVVGKRYKCLICINFDLCEHCFMKLRYSHLHPFNSMTKSKATIYHNVACDGCGIKPVTKIKHSCNVCQNFDYCDECFVRNRSIHNHPFSSTT